MMKTTNDRDGRGQKLLPLRINAKTVIYVTEDKCNEEYAMRVRSRFSKSTGRGSLNDMAPWTG